MLRSNRIPRQRPASPPNVRAALARFPVVKVVVDGERAPEFGVGRIVQRPVDDTDGTEALPIQEPYDLPDDVVWDIAQCRPGLFLI